jgi:site-specific recombinase XerD
MSELERDTSRHIYFEETAWSELKLAEKYLLENRKARAQEHFVKALFFSQKLDAEFTNREFSNDLTRLNNILYRGY